MKHGASLASVPTLRAGFGLARMVRPRVAVFVVLAAMTGALLAAGPNADLGRVFLAALLVGAVAGGASVFNQVIERDFDQRMRRTAERPLVVGTVSVRDATLFGGALTLIGTLGLASAFNVLSALLALSTLVVYALVYTPLKRQSSLNTVVGAVPGAMPPLIGAAALAGVPTRWGWMLFAIVFAWQFPHFMAIAWLYREDYKRAGMKMLTTLAGGEAVAGRQAFLYSLLLIPTSLLPAVRGDAGPIYLVSALVLGAAYASSSAAFAWKTSRRSARVLLLVSLVYLPMILSVALIDPVASFVLQG